MGPLPASLRGVFPAVPPGDITLGHCSVVRSQGGTGQVENPLLAGRQPLAACWAKGCALDPAAGVEVPEMPGGAWAKLLYLTGTMAGSTCRASSPGLRSLPGCLWL